MFELLILGCLYACGFLAICVSVCRREWFLCGVGIIWQKRCFCGAGDFYLVFV